MQEIVIGTNEAGQRFDKYLHKYFKEAPSSFIYKMLRKKNIELNGKKATGSEKLKVGDSVKLFMADETIAKFKGSQGKSLIKVAENNFAIDINSKHLNIIKDNLVYEDDNIIILNKPAGILSQKSIPSDVSINEMIIEYLIDEGKMTEKQLETFKPSVCNRLDRNTTGLITFGKTLKGIQELSQGFKDRSFDKYYLAAVWGKVDKPALIDGYLVKDAKTNKASIVSTVQNGEASYIKTAYEPLCTTQISDRELKYDVTLLKIKLITGKTHQIRAHLSSINHSILGDDKYGVRKRNELLKSHYDIKWQMLHSYELKFNDNNDFEALNILKGKTICAKPGKSYTKVFKSYFK